MLGMIVDPFTWSMVRLAGQAGRTGLRWDLADQAPINLHSPSRAAETRLIRIESRNMDKVERAAYEAV